MLNALSIDVEDYYQVTGFERQIARHQWDQFESRVVANTQRLLELLAKHNVRATFFVLGWVAQRFPQLVREIQAAEHEIGSHSFWHRLVYEQSPDEFREDLRQSRTALEDAIGGPVTAYRAPSFSITKRSLWALEILVEEGFQIDSSIFPVYHDRYGIPDAPAEPYHISTPSGTLQEFPVSIVRLAGMNLPVSGGGYFRLYPSLVTHTLLSRINRRQQRPFVFYLHPWEIDPEQPRLQAGSRIGRFRHRVNLKSTAHKLESLLTRFRFGTLTESLASISQEAAPAVCTEQLAV
ncbi:MAG TPA: XrtA system polysaccharide deacetylase [Pirellulales bacterium]|jgi:polysaccharide deacetylase family protein (PEP-CTERM system associated)